MFDVARQLVALESTAATGTTRTLVKVRNAVDDRAHLLIPPDAPSGRRRLEICGCC